MGRGKQKVSARHTTAATSIWEGDQRPPAFHEGPVERQGLEQGGRGKAECPWDGEARAWSSTEASLSAGETCWQLVQPCPMLAPRRQLAQHPHS